MKLKIKSLLVLLIALPVVACKPTANSKEQSESYDSAEVLSAELYHRVEFVNYDNTPLLTINVLDGQEAIYTGATPVHVEDDEFTYEFAGWDKNLTSIKTDTKATAQFTPVPKENWGSIEWF